MVPAEVIIVIRVTFWSRTTWSRVRKFNLPIFLFFSRKNISSFGGGGLGTLARDDAVNDTHTSQTSILCKA
jgi:hypothetical protein